MQSAASIQQPADDTALLVFLLLSSTILVAHGCLSVSQWVMEVGALYQIKWVP